MITRNCDHCRRIFEASGKGRGKRRYCSPECQEAARYASRRRWQRKRAARHAEAMRPRREAAALKRAAIRQQRVEAYMTMPAAIAAKRFGVHVGTIRRAVREAGMKPTWAHRRPLTAPQEAA